MGIEIKPITMNKIEAQKALTESFTEAFGIIYDALLNYVKEYGLPFSENPRYYINEFGLEEENVGNVLEISCSYVCSLDAKEKDFEYNSILLLYVVEENGQDTLKYYGFYNGGCSLDEDGCEPIHDSVFKMKLDELCHLYSSIK